MTISDRHADAAEQARIVALALPYLRRYAGATIVVKYGGHAMGEESLAEEFGRDIALLKQVGINPVVVHGGGPQINAMLKRLAIQSTFVDGLRVTDAAMVEVVEMVLAGTVNKMVAGLINRAGALGANRLLMLTDVAGVLDRNGKLIPDLSIAEVEALRADGTISGGMIPKVETCIEAVRQGVKGATIVDGRVPHACLLELFTEGGIGTLIHA